MKYTVIMGRYELPHPYAYNACFVEMKRVEVEAPSAYNAKMRAMDQNPGLEVDRVQ